MTLQTQEQFNEIMDTYQNGNHEQAKELCAEYNFIAADLIKMYSDTWDYRFGEIDKCLMFLAEGAERIRSAKRIKELEEDLANAEDELQVYHEKHQYDC